MEVKNKEEKNEVTKEKRKPLFDEEEYKRKLEKKKKLKIIIPIISACVVIFVLLACTGFALVNINSNKVLSNIYIQNMSISGLTKEEVLNKINNNIEEKLNKDIIIKDDEFEYSIKLSQIETKYDVEKSVQSAYNIGRNGNIFQNNFEIIKTLSKRKDIDLEFSYNEELLEKIINDINAKIPNSVIEPSYYIEENNLIIVKGKKGNVVNKEELKNKIMDILKNDNPEYTIKLNTTEVDPEKIDINKIHEEVYKEAKDAYYTKDPFQVYPHEDGIDFDINEATELLKEDKEEYEIKLKITKPKITTADLGTEAFPDLLSSFSTKYDASNVNRTNNLVLAMKSLNGVVVAPGEVFSYNKTLGKRTIQAGYREAGGFAGGRVVQLVGGGICQISSTLYNAVVYANMEIVERYNHMFLAGYVGAGKDATVSYGTLDFKFKNTRKYPIVIKTSIGSGVAKVSIYGIKEEVEYEIEISTQVLSYSQFSTIYEDDYSLQPGQEKVVQNGMNGCKSITYKIVKLNGSQISSSVLSSDEYDPMNKIVKRNPKVVQQPEPQPQQQEQIEQEPEHEPQEQTEPDQQQEEQEESTEQP